MPMDINDLARGFVTGTVDDAGRRDARVSGRYALVKIPARNGSVNAFETAAVRESDGTVMMLSRPGFGVESRFEEAIRGACEELDVPMIYDLTIEMTIGLSFAELRRGLDDGRARRGLDLFAARLVIETGGRTVADVFDGPVSTSECAELYSYSQDRVSSCWRSPANGKPARGDSFATALRWVTTTQRHRRVLGRGA